MELKDEKRGKEVREFMCVYQRPIGFARQNNGSLSNEECEVILYYAKDLQREMIPYCKTHHDTSHSAGLTLTSLTHYRAGDLAIARVLPACLLSSES